MVSPLRLALLFMQTNTTLSNVAQAAPPQKAKTQRAATPRTNCKRATGLSLWDAEVREAK